MPIIQVVIWHREQKSIEANHSAAESAKLDGMRRRSSSQAPTRSSAGSNAFPVAGTATLPSLWNTYSGSNRKRLLLLTTPISRKRAASRALYTRKRSKANKARDGAKRERTLLEQLCSSSRKRLMCLAKELGAGTHAGASTTGGMQ